MGSDDECKVEMGFQILIKIIENKNKYFINMAQN